MKMENEEMPFNDLSLILFDYLVYL